MDNPHRLAEARSLAYHRAVAERLRERPEVLDGVRDRVETWLAEGHPARVHLERWREILSGSLPGVLDFITSDTEEARELRQSTPFAGLVPPRERWRIWAETRRGAAS